MFRCYLIYYGSNFSNVLNIHIARGIKTDTLRIKKIYILKTFFFVFTWRKRRQKNYFPRSPGIYNVLPPTCRDR